MPGNMTRYILLCIPFNIIQYGPGLLLQSIAYTVQIEMLRSGTSSTWLLGWSRKYFPGTMDKYGGPWVSNDILVVNLKYISFLFYFLFNFVLILIFNFHSKINLNLQLISVSVIELKWNWKWNEMKLKWNYDYIPFYFCFQLCCKKYC